MVVVVVVVICLGGLIGFIWYRQSATFVSAQQRRKLLSDLPLHTMLYNKVSDDVIMAILDDKDFDPNILAKKDFDERNAFHVAILPQCNYGDRVVRALLEHLLPVKEGAPVPGSTHEIVPTSFHGDAWFQIVMLDQYKDVVEYILTHHSSVIDEALAKACDERGRRAVDLASPENKKILKQCMYLFKTYELITARNAPHHRSYPPYLPPYLPLRPIPTPLPTLPTRWSYPYHPTYPTSLPLLYPLPLLPYLPLGPTPPYPYLFGPIPNPAYINHIH